MAVGTALALAQLVPGVLRYFSEDSKPTKVSDILIDTAKYVTRSHSEEGALAVLQKDPEALQRYIDSLNQKEIALAQAAAQDRDSARKRDIKIIELRGSNTRADVLAYSAIALLAGCLAALFFVDIPSGSKDALMLLIGALIVVVKEIYGFDFGSSAGSKSKDSAMQEKLNERK